MAVIRGKLQIGFKPRSVTDAEKRAILTRDDEICQYCGEDAQCVDHIIAREWQWDDSPDNLVSACNLCNLVAGNRLFKNFTEKRFWILDRLLATCRRSKAKIWTLKELDELQGRLRRYVADNSIVVESEQERDRIEQIIQSQRDGVTEQYAAILRGARGRARDYSGEKQSLLDTPFDS